MILSDFITRVADDSNNTSTISGVKARLIREINRIGAEVWNGYEWSFRWRNYRIVTDVDYTTGTVTATNGSRTITGAGTTFASSHVSWHIYFPGDSVLNWYKVRAFTSTTQLELDVPYQGTSGSLKTYILRHFDYTLPTEPWDMGSFISTCARKPLNKIDAMSADLYGPASLYKGWPQSVAIFGSDSTPTVYSTGTLSGTINTATITGSGTSWLANIYPGDLVTIGSYSYTVRSVDSDTQITLYQQQQVTSAALTTYTITRQFGRIMRIMWPSDQNYTIDIRALRIYQPLVNDNDTNELLYRCPNALALKVSALELKRKGDVRAQIIEKDAEMALMRAKAEDATMSGQENIAPIFSPRTGGRDYGGSIFA